MRRNLTARRFPRRFPGNPANLWSCRTTSRLSRHLKVGPFRYACRIVKSVNSASRTALSSVPTIEPLSYCNALQTLRNVACRCHMSFKKNVEDFMCEQCGMAVSGSGYTNHCTRCLWSKHIDLDPGDRSHPCGGMMEPLRLEGSSPKYVLVHKCVRCQGEKRNSVASNDRIDALTRLAERRVP